MSLAQELAELRNEFKQLRGLFQEAMTIIDQIPECPIHGKRCPEFSREWIEKAKKAYVDDLSNNKPVRWDPRLRYECTRKAIIARRKSSS